MSPLKQLCKIFYKKTLNKKAYNDHWVRLDEQMEIGGGGGGGVELVS